MSSSKLTVETLVVGQMGVNCYIVSARNEAVVVDPGDDGEFILGKIQQKGARLTAIVATHGHFDHVMAAFEVQLAFGAPFYIHADDAFFKGCRQRHLSQ